MPGPDRSRFIELLRRLGAVNDETVLKAARELHRSLEEAGLDWDHILRADGARAAELDDDQSMIETEVVEIAATPTDESEDMKIVDRLLARRGLSDSMRSDLNEFKQSIRAGTFDKIDADYIRALAKRLGASPER